MNVALNIVLLSAFACIAGCDAGGPPVRAVPPHPSASSTFQALDLRKLVESAMPKELAWQGPVAGGSGEATSAGEGSWHATGRFMIHADEQSIAVFRRTLRETLEIKIEGTGAQLRASEKGGVGPVEIGYSNGKHQGKVVARIELTPESSSQLVPDGRLPTHQLTIELSEDHETGNE